MRFVIVWISFMILAFIALLGLVVLAEVVRIIATALLSYWTTDPVVVFGAVFIFMIVAWITGVLADKYTKEESL